jgi:predicted HicB family RNase H-like nuclease
MMEYKGYIGQVEFDDEAAIFHGKVSNTRDVITFEGESVAELRKAFRESVDVYLAYCAERGEEPDKPFSGQFVTSITPELHRRASLAAARAGKSLNTWVAEQLQSVVGRSGDVFEHPPRNKSKVYGGTTTKKPAKGSLRRAAKKKSR